MQTAAALNLQDYVAPNHWSVAQFEAFPGLSVDEEFDAIAPLLIYFEADGARSAAARQAAKRLEAAGHPLLVDCSAAEFTSTSRTPAGLAERYNALIMVLADEAVPGIGSGIDEHGAYYFESPAGHAVLSGDAPGFFAFYDNAAAVRRTLKPESQSDRPRRARPA